MSRSTSAGSSVDCLTAMSVGSANGSCDPPHNCDAAGGGVFAALLRSGAGDAQTDHHLHDFMIEMLAPVLRTVGVDQPDFGRCWWPRKWAASLSSATSLGSTSSPPRTSTGSSPL